MIITSPKTNSLIFKILTIAFIFSGLILESYAQKGPAQIIPDFTFYKISGQSFARKDLAKNKKLVIVFFDITCDHCQNELKAISGKIEQFKNAQFYLVSMDNIAGIEAFMKKFATKMNGRTNVMLLRDLNKQFITRFQPIQFPATYVYRPDWRLIKYFGQNSNVNDIITAVNLK